MSKWTQTAKKGGSGEQFEKAPPGNHPAVCVAIIDMGEQWQDGFQGAKGHWQARAFFVWELVTKEMTGTKGRNHVIGIDLTVSLNSKAKLRKWIEARTGKQIAEGAEYDISKELGAKCLLNVVLNGDWPKVDGMSAVPDGLPFPAHQNTPFILSLDEFQKAEKKDGGIPEWVPYLYGEPLVDHILRCKELAGDSGKGRPTGQNSTAMGTPAKVEADHAHDDGSHHLWDFSDGTPAGTIKNLTTEQVRAAIAESGLPLGQIRLKPAGAPREAAKTADQWGFAVAPVADPIPF